MSSELSISGFIDNHVESLKAISFRQFFTEFQSLFYPNYEISFMDNLLEMSKKEYEGKFVVHHEKLFSYGLMHNADTINDIRKRLAALGLSENEDYQLTKFSDPSRHGGHTTKTVYMLTPEGFKLALMRSQNHKKNTSDVSKYAKYYVLLDKVIGYYDEYHQRLNDALSSVKDDKINEQSNLINQLQSLLTSHDLNTQKRFQMISSKQDLLLEIATETNYYSAKRIDCVARKEPFFGMTFVLMEDHNDDLFIRTHFIHGKCSQLTNRMIDLVSRNFTSSDAYSIVRCHQIVIPPIYFEREHNITEQAYRVFKEIRSQKVRDYNQLIDDSDVSSEKITVRNIPISWNTSYIDYKPNNFFEYDEIITIFTDLLQKTEGCSYNTPTSDILFKIVNDTEKDYEEDFYQIEQQSKYKTRIEAEIACSCAIEILENDMPTTSFYPNEEGDKSSQCN